MASERSQPKTTHSSRKGDGSPLASSPIGIAPLCACGCGGNPKWNPRHKRWGRFIFGHSQGLRLTRYREKMNSLRRVSGFPQAPPCKCGCGESVSIHPHGAGNYWADYVVDHQMIGRRGIHSKKSLADRSRRMRLHNPMKDPDIAAKSRRSAAAVISPSKTEIRFAEWCKSKGLPLVFVGDGQLWVNRKNPDFRVASQGKVVELSQEGIFNGQEIQKRHADDYGLDKVRHYRKSRWQCLVIFVRHRQELADELAQAIRDFAKLGTLTSGVWNFDELLLFDESSSTLRSQSLTSTARQPKCTSPMAS
jgi:hypothetical protein